MRDVEVGVVARLGGLDQMGVVECFDQSCHINSVLTW